MTRQPIRMFDGLCRPNSFSAIALIVVLVAQSVVAAPPATPATQAVTQTSWTPEALEELLAPIALYPDQLLGQILAASINSQEVLDGGNWLIQNQNLTGKDLDAAAQKAGFGPAMLALVQFPTVIDMMCEQIDWTKQLGSAFNTDQKSVLDAVQRLRKEAQNVGNLKSSKEQTVATKTEGGNTYIEVKPADSKTVYVPQYDPQVVYVTPPPPGTTTTTTTTGPKGTSTTTSTTTPLPASSSTSTATTETKKEKDGVDSGTALAIGLIGFAAGIAIGSSMNDDYYYPAWGYGGVYYGGRPFYPPAYVYRPVYGPAFRPAAGYARPVNYRNNYNNVRVNNININNNNNYYNRFDNNQNLKSGGSRSPIANSPNRAQQQPRASQTPAGGNSGNWKGQSTYQGARTGNNAAGARPSTPTAQPANRPAAGTSNAAARADRGYETAAKPAAADRKATTSAQPANRPSSGGGAFSGAQSRNSGGFQRSASARGNASAGSRPTATRARR